MDRRTRRTARIATTVAVLAALALAAVVLAVPYGTAPPPAPRDEAFVFDRVAATHLVDPATGDVRVTEDLDVRFLAPRRGIIRDIPLRGSLGRTDVDVVDVTADGRPHPHLVGEEGELRTIRIGDPDVTRTGPVAYRLTYDLRGVGRADGDGTVWRLNVHGTTWEAPAPAGTFRVATTAGRVTDVTCVIGRARALDPCPSATVRDGAAEILSGPLPEGHGVTVQVRVEDAPASRLPEHTLGELTDATRWPTVAVLLALALVGGVRWVRLPRRAHHEGRARVEGTGVQVVSPRGWSPVELAAVHGLGHLRPGDADAATLLWLANRQVLVIDEARRDALRVHAGPVAPTRDHDVDLVEVLTGGGGTAPVTWSSTTDPSTRQRLRRGLDAHRGVEVAAVERRLDRRLPRRPPGWGAASAPLALVAVVAACGAVALHVLGVSAPGTVAVAALVGALPASIWRSASPHRLADLDEPALDAWRLAHGLYRVIDEGRDDLMRSAADDPNVPLDNPWLELLPYAVAFGRGRAYADRYGPQLEAAAREHPEVTDVASVRALTAGTALRTATAPPPSSSSSGGGGSGSGGGGGGGRSW